MAKSHINLFFPYKRRTCERTIYDACSPPVLSRYTRDCQNHPPPKGEGKKCWWLTNVFASEARKNLSRFEKSFFRTKPLFQGSIIETPHPFGWRGERGTEKRSDLGAPLLDAVSCFVDRHLQLRAIIMRYREMNGECWARASNTASTRTNIITIQEMVRELLKWYFL